MEGTELHGFNLMILMGFCDLKMGCGGGEELRRGNLGPAPGYMIQAVSTVKV
jgi:hypothetical protein